MLEKEVSIFYECGDFFVSIAKILTEVIFNSLTFPFE